MARQREDQTLRTSATTTQRHYIGIDPGDRWVGYCKLRVSVGVNVTIYQADMGVLERSLRLDKVVDRLIPISPISQIAVEEYNQRSVGFNKFRSSDTLKLIGALNYLAAKHSHTWAMVRPSQADLDALIIGKYLKKWDKHLPASPNWRHAYSAWRALARWMLVSSNTDLHTIAELKQLPHLTYRQNSPAFSEGQVTAPTISWEIEL
jgi:hypothetical protein